MLTVLLTTRGRASELAATLAAHEALEAPRGGHRLVIVVDGASDDTLALLASWVARFPPGSVEVVPTPQIGQNAARNRVLARLEGDLVVFTDDDAIPRPDWLRSMREAADAHPEADVIAGTVLPRFQVAPPEHVLRAVRLGPAFAQVSRPEEGPVDPTEAVGPSFAVRAARFASGLRFAEGIGPDGTEDYAMGSETELLLRLQRLGASAWYAKGAVVEHLVTRAQVAEDAILRRAYRYGRGRWRLGTSRLAKARVTWRGVPLSLSFDLLARRRAYRRARRRGDAEATLRLAWRIAYLAGHVAEIRCGRGAGSGLGAFAAWIPEGVLLAITAPAARAAAVGPEVARREPSSARAAGGA